jgi:prepilin-type N-terminal cleavage/methylation domain-containing protein
MMKTKRHQAGLSLVELMVAIAVGLILLAGLIQLLVSNKQAYRLQEGILDMQENARYSLQTLSYDLRMAGHWGGVAADDIRFAASTSDCKGKLIGADLAGLSGFEGGSTPPTPTGCIAAADYVANSDVLVVRYASVDSRVAKADLDNADNKDDLFVGSVAGMGGALYTGTKLKSDVTQDMVDIVGEPIYYNYPFYLAAYFIRPCSVKAGSACAATDDNGSPIPTLTRLILRGTSVTQEAVAQGVEQMQIEYGIGMGGDVDEYKDADAMTSSDWNKVSAVRIALVTRSGNSDFSYTDPNNSSSNVYDLPGDDSDDDYFATGDAVHYRRKVITQVIQVRNSGRN